MELLEPESPDSLLAWGLLSTLFEQKEYIAPQVLEALVLESTDYFVRGVEGVEWLLEELAKAVPP